MAKSFTYYLALLIIKCKGIKKIFSQDPINYKLLRMEDVHFPNLNHFANDSISRFQLMDTSITEIKSKSKKLIIYVHGGAFIFGPTRYHWDAVETLAKSTQCNMWVCDYPKAPEHKISTINKNIDLVYETAKNSRKFEEIVLIGDSAGATLILTLIQRKKALKFSLPSKIILISPVLDASFENPNSIDVEKKDPILSLKGLLSAKKMCISDGNLKNSSISPLFGEFKGFPETHLFIAEHDITYPDQLILCRKLKEQGVEHHVEIGKGMPHIWPLIPVMTESKKSLKKIIELVN